MTIAPPSQESAREQPTAMSLPGAIRRTNPIGGWLGDSRLGLAVMALIVGAAAGLGAVVFRELVYALTWVATGHQQFGQQGHAASSHLKFLGIWFVLVVPVIGGLLYGPLIQRFAPEARGHGVPEVMLAVAAKGGRIRPPVTIVKALASAICIGTGGSVGREGPIVQIGSALASTLGQLVRMSENHMRVIVACGAAGGIAATFNAPLTGLFFGFEIVLRVFSLDALFATSLAAVTGDLISRAFFGSGPFFAGVPHGLTVGNDAIYLLIALLGLIAGLIGVGFKTVLYRLEDLCDQLWECRPEWARPAVGGVALGLLLLALPQMYGVGYPVMDRVLAGHEVLWFIVILMLGKILAASLTLSIGGSGGVFAPSLFTARLAIVHQARVDIRLQMLFWHLADRWGRVGPDGVTVPLRLTHTVLSDLVAARRPTVTTALSDLAKTGLVQPLNGGWLLSGEPPGELLELRPLRVGRGDRPTRP